MSAADGDAALIRVGTLFRSLDELVAQAGTLLSDDIIAATAAVMPPPGERRRFQVRLLDGTVVLEGLGEVLAGKRLRIVELDAASRPVHERILAGRRSPPRPIRTAPPPFRTTPEEPPAPAIASAPVPVALALPPPVEAPAPAPAPELAAPPAPRATPTWTNAAGSLWANPWLRSRRVRSGLGVTGVIFLIGIIAALARDDDAPRASAGVAGAARPNDARPGQPSPRDAAPEDAADAEVAVDEDPEPPPETPPEPPPAKERTRPPAHPERKPKPPASRPPAKKKPPAGRQVRLSVRSDPAGASIRVDGAAVTGGSIMVPGGATVKVTATKRGYKRVTRSVKVGKATSIVLKMQRM